MLGLDYGLILVHRKNTKSETVPMNRQNTVSDFIFTEVSPDNQQVAEQPNPKTPIS